MIFEVDNTTHQLLSELQDSIRQTISSLGDSQEELKTLADEIKEKVLDIPDEVVDLRRSCEESNTQFEESITEKFKNLESLIVEKLSGLIDEEKYNMLVQEITGCKDSLTKIGEEALNGDKELLKKQREETLNLEKKLSVIETELKKESLKVISNISKVETTNDEIQKALSLNAQRGEIEEYATQIMTELSSMRCFFEEKYLNAVVEQISKITTSMDEYKKDLDNFEEETVGKINGLKNCMESISSIEKRNNMILESVANYMLLPGYRRFFKGMETIDEKTE